LRSALSEAQVQPPHVEPGDPQRPPFLEEDHRVGVLERLKGVVLEIAVWVSTMNTRSNSEPCAVR
jgi:hypothetical protein